MSSSLHTGPSEVDDVTVVDGSAPAESPSVAAGSRLGRYVLLEEVGSGGMGVVMAAYDTELDRRVALKLLRPHLSRRGEARMRREARSLAQLQHPSVITVFEVGAHEGQLFIAMEYIEGLTFDRWVDRRQPAWPRVIEIAIDAARGLAAAHAVGLVHRDIKPSNILVGKDGRVCVADFGIATAIDPAVAAEEPPLAARRVSGSQDTVEVRSPAAAISGSVRVDGAAPRTEVGTVVGTPAYMSPEQHRGEGVDARSDQFAFCVALYRVLYQEAPFDGEELESLRAAVSSGEVRPPPSGTDVPVAVRRVLLRGLSASPSGRWPSMEALIEALQRALGRRRRRTGVIVAAALVAAGVVGAAVLPEEPVEQLVCPSASERLRGVWDDERRVAMRDAFTASERPYAVDAFTRTAERLDAHAAHWSERYAAVCEQLDGAGASVELDMEMACLRERREELGALVELLARADEKAVAKATQAAAELESVETCEARGAEEAQLASPPASQRDEVEEIRLVLARAEAAYKAGLIGLGKERAHEARERAAALGYLPVQVEALYRAGQLEGLDGQLDQAAGYLADAALRAVEARHDRIAVRAATMQAFVVGYQQGRHEEGLTWLRHATAALGRMGADPLLDAELRVTRAAILTAQGSYEPALADFRAGLRQREEALGADHPIVASSFNNLGSVLVELGRYEDALEALEKARGIWERAYGPRHPVVGTAENGIGAVLEQMGRWDEARERLELALQIREEAFGPDHVNVAITLDNLGSVLTRLGDYPRARTAIERSLDLRTKTLGPRHPHVGSSLVNLGLVAEREGRLDEAAQHDRGAIELWEELLGPEHPYLGFPLTGLGRVMHAQGNDDEARDLLERALSIREAVGKPLELAETRIALAEVLWATEPARARELAERARSEALGDALGRVSLRDEIDAWLADHPLP